MINVFPQVLIKCMPNFSCDPLYGDLEKLFENILDKNFYISVQYKILEM